MSINLDQSINTVVSQLVISDILGKTEISELRFENPDGSALVIDTDYFGNRRNKSKPTVGPFENIGVGFSKIKIW